MSDSDNQQSNPLDDIVLAKEFLEGSRVAELQNILQDPDATPEKLLSVIPAGQIVMLAMHVGEQWESLLSDLPMSVQPDSRALHDLAHKLVPRIGEHPAVQHIFSNALSDADEEDPSEIDWHRITSITPTFWWIGDLGSLVPWVRFGFRNARRELLLETTANFGDMAYLASALTLLLKNNMERALDAKKRGALSMEPVEAAADHINELLQYASEISDFLKELIPSEKKPNLPLESLPPAKGS